jgi:hypothetical protein
VIRPPISCASSTIKPEVAQAEALNKYLVTLEQKLAKERLFRIQVQNKLRDFLSAINDSVKTESLTELVTQIDSAELAVGKAECDELRRLLNELSERIDSLAVGLKAEITSYTAKIAEQLKEWTTKETQTKERIEEIRRELEAQKIKLDMAFIRKVTQDATKFDNELNELQKLKPKMADARGRRQKLMQERQRLRSRLFAIRTAFATQMTSNLATTVVDYHVKIRFHEGNLSKELEENIKTWMEWRTSQVPKAAVIVRELGLFKLLDAVIHKKAGVFEALRDDGGQKIFNRFEADKIISKLNEWHNRTWMQRCIVEDRPEILVTKETNDASGKPSYSTKNFTQLSLGQQQSILLSIMLFSKSTAPLIIDQPEDNLDSEFIYKTLVKTLRGVKEQRQVIVVTHNANIAVLGDAELIVPLRGQSELSVIRDRGSIDTPTTKEIVCTILEGSKRAFKRRYDMYGIT